jgi:uncharacterized Fe-S cluster protein YjdI/CDGSH-type Zn-finger protein
MSEFEEWPPGDQVKVYQASGVQVRYDARRCRHSAACVQGAPEVFDPQARPWIQPEKADPEKIAEVVGRCPTGALHFLLAGGEPEQPERPTVISPTPDGPLLVRGDLRISGPWGSAREVRAALCRCGSSGNKPFCDGSHERIGWRDGVTRQDGATRQEGQEVGEPTPS